MREYKETCPCCGFITLSEIAVYEICVICGWEDDPAQIDHPLSAFGPNHESLFDAQNKALKLFPRELLITSDAQWANQFTYRPALIGPWHRDEQWRPLLADECSPETAQSGMQYFQMSCEAMGDRYWIPEPTDSNTATTLANRGD